MSITQIVILAGGKGTRLAQNTPLPKPLASVAGKPAILHQVQNAYDQGWRKFLFLLGYEAQKVQDVLEDVKPSFEGAEFEYSIEPEPLGTAGALFHAWENLESSFFLFYADTVFSIDLKRMAHQHRMGSDVTLFVHPNDHPQDSDLVEIGVKNEILELLPKTSTREKPYYRNFAVAALYCIEKKAFENFRSSESCDVFKDILPRVLDEGWQLSAYVSPEYIKDMGTPSRLEQVERDVNHGLVEAKSLLRDCPAVFIDRDGTLNIHRGHLSKIDQLELLPGVGHALKKLNSSPYRSVLITNQPVIARGELTESGLEEIHAKLETKLLPAYLDRLYYCPHHPNKGFSGERVELKRVCDCRKPNPGMLREACKDLHIDMTQSWMIGDATTDVLAAKNANVRSVLLRTGLAGLDHKYKVRADFTCFDFSDAVDFILRGYDSFKQQVQTWIEQLEPGDCIAISGLSCSGKSLLAGVIHWELQKKGLKSLVVPLDAWLRSFKDRTETQGLAGRYDYEGIEHWLDRSQINKIGYYQPLERKHYPDYFEIERSSEHVLILEGVVAFDVPNVRDQSRWKIYIECDEGIRKQRMQRFYHWRGISDSEFQKLYESREKDEHAVLRQQKALADVVVKSEESKHDY